MDISKALPRSVTMEYQDEELNHFRCRKCHDVGHLYKECPLLAKERMGENTEGGKFDEFKHNSQDTLKESSPQNKGLMQATGQKAQILGGSP